MIRIFLISLFILILFGCKKGKEDTEYKITYLNNNLVVPSNATIVYNGQQYHGNVSIPKNKLIGIVKDNKAYLYFTGMGSANLNDSTSRRAVGYLMFSNESSGKSNKSLDLTTGIRIEQNGTQYKFTNLKKRFAAIECQNNTDYLFQRGEIWPDINWIGAIKGENQISILEYDNTTFSNINQANTYGASIRLLTIPVGAPLTWGIIAQKNSEALNSGANSSILVNVNFIDFLYFTLKGVNEIVGALPIPFLDCWAAYVTNAAGNTLHSVLTELLTHDDHITKQNWQNFTNDLLNGYFNCLVSNGIEATGVGLIVKQFLDIVSSGQWIIDNTLILSIDIITCSVYETWAPTGQVPVLTTSVSDITPTTATCGGNITSQGSFSVTARGVCWRTSQNPTIYDAHTTDGSGAGSYTSNITGLSSNTPYYVRAYATNGAGTAYGNQISFTTLQGTGGTVTDIDGNVYNTITIGTQVWMVENLKTTHYRNGDAIPNVTDNGQWYWLMTGAYCNYDNDVNNSTIYGKLYNWFAVNDSQNIAPTGWHVSSDDDWDTLAIYLGGRSIAGDKLKEAGTSHWYSPNAGATNETGFTALPGGYRNYDGSFIGISYQGNWWSSSRIATYANFINMLYEESCVFSLYTDKAAGNSVRCVKD